MVNDMVTGFFRECLRAVPHGCKCGYYGHPTKECRCTPYEIRKYLSRVSGPLLDRFDLHIEVPPVEYHELTGQPQGESSQDIRLRVNKARNIQKERYQGGGVFCNAHLNTKQLRKFCSLDEDSLKLIEMAINTLGFSARAYDRILKVARTIADLEGVEKIQSNHVSEAIQYRSLDRDYWG